MVSNPLDASARLIEVQDKCVLASAVSKGPINCPHCQGTDVLLQSEYRRTVVEMIRKNEIVESSAIFDPDVRKVAVAVQCQSCMVKFEIIQDAEFNLRRTVIDLLSKIAHLEGRAPVSTDKVM